MDAETDSGFQSTIGIVYRHPKANLTKCHGKMCNALEKIGPGKSIEIVLPFSSVCWDGDPALSW